jgi:TadE-like protein
MQGLRRLRSEVGQATIELLSATPVLILGALLVWQMCLVGVVLTSAQNAARTGARVLSRNGDPNGAEDAAMHSLRPTFRHGAEYTAIGDTVRVKVNIPLLVPGIELPVGLTESASMPNTSL